MTDEIQLQDVIHEEKVVKINVKEVDRPKPKRALKTAETENIKRTSYAANRNVAEGLMDLALLTANANQLRFLITYNSKSSTFYLSLGLIILSLVLQVAVGIGLIFKRRTDRKSKMLRTNQFLVGGVFMITFVNILIAAFTSTNTSTNSN